MVAAYRDKKVVRCLCAFFIAPLQQQFKSLCDFADLDGITVQTVGNWKFCGENGKIEISQKPG
jgi:hypothetical protein